MEQTSAPEQTAGTQSTPAAQRRGMPSGLVARVLTYARTNKMTSAVLATVAGALIVALALAAVAVGAGGNDAERAADASDRPRLLAPKDGSLQVAGTKVPQLLGSCDGRSCYHVPPAHAVNVAAGARKSLPLKAGQSELFTVGAFNIARRSQPVPISIRGTDLVVGQMAKGTYLVTVSGRPHGGTWQFQLTVAK
jgi:hypothetical protein